MGFYLRKTRLDTLVVGFGRAGRAGLGWAWGLALAGALGWVGHGVWLWWARWAGLGQGRR